MKYPNLHLLGRLAEYKYYNMDAIAARALELAERYSLTMAVTPGISCPVRCLNSVIRVKSWSTV